MAGWTRSCGRSHPTERHAVDLILDEARRRPGHISLVTLGPLTNVALALAKALKARGFSFVGPTTAYAGMQACGLVDDHLQGCHVAAA